MSDCSDRETGSPGFSQSLSLISNRQGFKEWRLAELTGRWAQMLLPQTRHPGVQKPRVTPVCADTAAVEGAESHPVLPRGPDWPRGACRLTTSPFSPARPGGPRGPSSPWRGQTGIQVSGSRGSCTPFSALGTPARRRCVGSEQEQTYR